MDEVLITFETAKLGKQKGFDIPYRGYNGEGILQPSWWHDIKDYSKMEYYFAPTQSFFQKWLREEKDLYVTVDCQPNFETESLSIDAWTYKIIRQGSKDIEVVRQYGMMYDSYEEALENGLKQALKLI